MSVINNRQYQVESIQSLRNGFKEGHVRQVLAAPTGAGKSVIMLDMIRKAVDKGSRVMFICERRILVEQFSKHLDAAGIGHGVLMAKHWRFRPYELVQVASAQTLEKMESLPVFDICFVDEVHACFVAGTLIDGNPIETIKVGDYVNSFNHESGLIEKKQVTTVFANKSNSLVQISAESGESFISTKCHPVFTQNGYEKASLLTHESMLTLINYKQHALHSNESNHKKSFLFFKNSNEVLELCCRFFSRIRLCIFRKALKVKSFLSNFIMSRCEESTQYSNKQKLNACLFEKWRVRANENKQSNEGRCNKEQSSNEALGNRTQAAYSWWKWSWNDCSSIFASFIFRKWMDFRVICKNWMQKGSRLSYWFKNRHSQCGKNDCNRSGWCKSQQQFSKGEGCSKELSIRPSRVVSVEVQKQRSINESGTNRKGSEFVDVFNIEVDGNNNYFANGILVHNCMRASIINLITTRPTLKIIGATATPFNPKIATHFSKVTCVTTMRQLVDDGYLVPFRVFVAREIDTKGLKVVAGEWQKDELEKRGQQIVGDVVADYVRISNEVFGGYRKTICFSCGIAHGADLAKKFNEVGINAVQISSNDDEEYRAEVLSDFAKPESDIKVVISVAILSRGFDQSDVDYVILARPLKKSFSEHVQMVGRGARIHPGKELCIASGQRVLTHRGLVAIEEVSIYDKLWDGISFVSHKGVIFKGFKNVITYQGLTATSDHLVKTKEGWRTFGDCSSEQIPIVQTGLGRSPIRESENIFSRSGVARETLAETDVRPLRMSNMLQKVFNFIQQFISRDSRRLRQMQPTKDHHQQNGSSEGCSAKAALYKSEKYSLSRLRWSGNYVQVRQCFGWLFMGHGELATTSRFDQISTGSDRQRKTLRAWESEVGNQLIQLVAHAKANVKCAFAFIQNHILANTLRRQHTKNSFWNGFERHTNHRKIPQAVQQTQRQVWDILDSGPRNCFTCEGLLVHNCVIQDNSGNWLRFQDSWETLYNDGVTELTGEQDKKSRKEPSDKEKKEAKCPKCAVVWVGNTDVCSHCGHVRERKNDVVAVAGEMFELGQSVKKEKYTAEQKASWYAQLLGYAEEKGHNLGSAYYRYKEKFGVAPSMAKPKPIGAGLEVRNWITSRNIANAKRKSK